MVKAAHVDKNGVKRGAWSEEEDNKLRAYILRYGHWNWRLLPKFAGLDRCGKSCRLRWMNYLKPGVKRGNYTKEERDLISQLHNEIGNKWSSIAAKLPGRSDNDIKNYWHTHIKKRSRRASPSSKSCQQAAAHETFHEKEKSTEIIHNLGHQKAFPGSDVTAAILCSNKLEKTDYKVSSDTYNVLESSTTSSSSNSASAVNWDLDLSSGRICSSILSCRSSYLGLSWEANDDSSTSSDPFSELIQESFWTEPFVLDTSDHTEDFNCLALDDGGIFAPDFSAYIMPSIYPNSVYKS